jgi:hypothetical protein
MRSGVWASNFEYLLWFIEHAETPLPLVSTDPALAPVVLPAAGIAIDHQSRLELQDRPLSGGRFTAEYWFLAEYDPVLASSPLFRVSGIEVNGFVLAERSVEFRNDFSPTLVRSFFDANNRRESGFVVAAPGVATGSLFGSGDVDLWGAEANYWQTLYANPPGQTCRVDAMGGFRYLNFNSGLTIQSQTVYNPVQVVPEFVPFAGNRIDVTDSFQTANDFFGGQVGLGLNYITPCMIITANLKLGLGFTAQEIQIAGRLPSPTPDCWRWDPTAGLSTGRASAWSRRSTSSSRSRSIDTAHCLRATPFWAGAMSCVPARKSTRSWISRRFPISPSARRRPAWRGPASPSTTNSCLSTA